MSVAGLLLAAGAGRRLGTPKALVTEDDGTSWLARSVEVLREGGCADVTVVLGAAAEQARSLVPDGCRVVVAEDWADGMGASLRAGLEAVEDGDALAVLVSLVDLPDVSADVVRRLLASESAADSEARAAYDGVPGHPVLLGRDHWPTVREAARGDRGARDHLDAAARAGRLVLVECGDLATGTDVDTRADLRRRTE